MLLVSSFDNHYRGKSRSSKENNPILIDPLENPATKIHSKYKIIDEFIIMVRNF